jgi:hypothetical protein
MDATVESEEYTIGSFVLRFAISVAAAFAIIMSELRAQSLFSKYAA